jgi:hypothetical protein
LLKSDAIREESVVQAMLAGELVAAATAAAATTSAGRAGGGFRGAAGCGGTEDGELDSGFFAGTLGAGDFLLAVDDDFFELGLAIVADVFVDRH